MKSNIKKPQKHVLHPVVSKSDEIIVLPYCRAFFFRDENKGLDEIGTFHFNGALIS
jgi:hypothetical protein